MHVVLAPGANDVAAHVGADTPGIGSATASDDMVTLPSLVAVKV